MLITILLSIALSGVFLAIKAAQETLSHVRAFLDFRALGFDEDDYTPECLCEDCIQEEEQNTSEERTAWKFEAYRKMQAGIIENLLLSLAYTVFLTAITIGAEYYLFNNFN